jgi:hypothetical protein
LASRVLIAAFGFVAVALSDIRQASMSRGGFAAAAFEIRGKGRLLAPS